MEATIGIIGIILAFAVFFILCFKDTMATYTALIAALIVVIFNGSSIVEAFTVDFMNGMGSYLMSYFLTIVFGTIMGRFYSVSGGAVSIARALSRVFLKREMSDKKRQVVAILVMLLAGGVLAYGGINLTMLIFTIYPLMLSICEEANIPKRFIAGIALGGTGSFAITMPGSPQMANYIGVQVLGTSSMSGLIPGLLGGLLIIILSVIILNAVISRAKARGEVFVYGPNDVVFDENAELPKWYMSVLPLLVTWILFNFVKMDLPFAQAFGLILCILIFSRSVKKNNNTIIQVCNEGAKNGAVAGIDIAMVMGFAYVVKSSIGFQTIINGLLSMKGSPYVTFPIGISVASAVAGSASAGQLLLLQDLAPHFIEMGIPAGAIHRIAAFACTCIDTLPCNPTVLCYTRETGCKLKETYSAFFITTVLSTIAATILVCVLFAMFPGLA